LSTRKIIILKVDKMRKIICGIDLGTTNASIAYLKEAKAEAIFIEEDQALVPSVVSLDEAANTVIVGRSARNRLAAFPEHAHPLD
jgi:molecular chaperone DnaK